MNLILTSGLTEAPLDEHHQFITIGQNCWGVGQTAKEAHKNAKFNAPRGARLFITRVALKGCSVDGVDGMIKWFGGHDAANCKFCTVGKGIRINTDKTFKE